MKQPLYEESKETCNFLAKCVNYIQIGSNSFLKLKLSLSLAKLINNRKARGFCGIFYKPTKLGKALKYIFPNISLVYLLPGIKLSLTPKPRRAYQEWCKELSWVKPNIAKVICDECEAKGITNTKIGELAWKMIEEERNYIPVITEIQFMVMSLILKLTGHYPSEIDSKNE